MKVRILIKFLVSLRLVGETLPCGGEEAGLQEYQVLRIEAGRVRWHSEGKYVHRMLSKEKDNNQGAMYNKSKSNQLLNVIK